MNEPRGDRIEEYDCHNLLGKGAFASVYRARCRISGRYVAIKMIDKHLMKINRMTERVKQEADIHRRLDHPAILQLYRFFEDVNFIYLVLELAEHGDIQQYLRLNSIQLTESETAHIMQQIVDGLKYLHANNILHRDMKLPNLLVTADMRVKIADFGLATQMSRPDEPHMTMCGTPNYISPEVAMRTAHGQPADVWGLGIMMYTLLVGRPPFDTDGVASTLKRVVQAELHIPMHMSAEARDLLDRLLQKDQTRRIRLDDVLRHPFMVNNLPAAATVQPGAKPVLAVVGDRDSGLMTMSTTPSMSTPSAVPSHNREFGARFQPLHEPIDEDNAMQYDLPPPRKPAVESGYAENYASSSNLNPFLVTPTTAGADRSGHRRFEGRHNSVYAPNGPAIAALQHKQPHEFITPTSRFPHHQQQENIRPNGQTAPHVMLSPPAIDVAQLNAERLLPTRYETKKAILSIDEQGRVLVELLRSGKSKAKSSDRCSEICRISRDGTRIEIYQPDPGRGDSNAVDTYVYPCVPTKHCKKYMYAARFVQLVRAKTPKITYYSSLAKCQLMETLDDFEMFFYAADERFTRSAGDGVRYTNAHGSVVDEREFGSRLDGPTAEQRDHYQHCWQHCVQLERALREMQCAGVVFPITVGRRPVTVPQVIGRKELGGAAACANVSSPRMPNMQSFAMSISSSTTSAHPIIGGSRQPSPFGNAAATGRVLVPGIGIATKSALGVLEVQYNDDTQLTVLPKEQGGGFVFRRSVSDPTAVPMRYTIADELPELVRVRLEQIPLVLKHMAALEVANVGGGINTAGAQIAATSTPLATRKLGAMRFCR